MTRLIGILTGSALAVAVLIVALGMPRLSPPDAGVADTHEAAADIAAPIAIDQPAPVTPQDEPPQPETADEEAPSPVTDTTLVEQLFAPEETRTIVAPPEPDVAVEEHWYAFWSPFRSELAANGFVSRLQETTGMDYRVVKVKTGVYEVAFAYTDDADIEAKLERIADATGLDMSGG